MMRRMRKVKSEHLLERLVLADDIVRQVRRKYRGKGPWPVKGRITVDADAILVRAAIGKRLRKLEGN